MSFPDGLVPRSVALHHEKLKSLSLSRHTAPVGDGAVSLVIVVGQPCGPGSLPFDYFNGQPGTARWKPVPDAAHKAFPAVARIMQSRVVRRVSTLHVRRTSSHRAHMSDEIQAPRSDTGRDVTALQRQEHRAEQDRQRHRRGRADASVASPIPALTTKMPVSCTGLGTSARTGMPKSTATTGINGMNSDAGVAPRARAAYV